MKKLCTFSGCTNSYWARGFCRPHSTHLYRYGEVRHLNNAPSPIITKGEVSYVVLFGRSSAITGLAIVDTEDVPKLKGLRFYITHGYAKLAVSSKTVYLHNIIAGTQPPLVCDHINRFRLDNRKSNLRLVSRAENNSNKGLPADVDVPLVSIQMEQGRAKLL